MNTEQRRPKPTDEEQIDDMMYKAEMYQRQQEDEIKTIKLSQAPGMVKAIAAGMIKAHGEYTCIIAGKRVRVIAD
jgi:hypothetical protein